jgi:phosphatidylglycerol:prolipoprotein diacylglycerol transferase
MRPVPTAFHLGPLEIHTYGIGLALTFWFAFRYFEHRLKARDYPIDWVPGLFFWVIVSAIVGARAMHVISNLGYYRLHPAEIFTIWHGGLSSFGGLLLAVPVGLFILKKRGPAISVAAAIDMVAPVLMAAWAMGRLLGPQLMVAGGGHQTSQWFGMYYAGQVGPRVPVPIIQALEDGAVLLTLLLIERHLRRITNSPVRPSYPAGTVTGVAMILWGIERSLDEHFLLGQDGALGSALVQIAGAVLVLGGSWMLLNTRQRWNRWREAGSPVDLASQESPTDA